MTMGRQGRKGLLDGGEASSTWMAVLGKGEGIWGIGECEGGGSLLREGRSSHSLIKMS